MNGKQQNGFSQDERALNERRKSTNRTVKGILLHREKMLNAHRNAAEPKQNTPECRPKQTFTDGKSRFRLLQKLFLSRSKAARRDNVLYISALRKCHQHRPYAPLAVLAGEDSMLGKAFVRLFQHMDKRLFHRQKSLSPPFRGGEGEINRLTAGG